MHVKGKWLFTRFSPGIRAAGLAHTEALTAADSLKVTAVLKEQINFTITSEDFFSPEFCLLPPGRDSLEAQN